MRHTEATLRSRWKSLFGRVVDAIGQPIDGKGASTLKRVSRSRRLLLVSHRVNRLTNCTNRYLAVDSMIPIDVANESLSSAIAPQVKRQLPSIPLSIRQTSTGKVKPAVTQIFVQSTPYVAVGQKNSKMYDQSTGRRRCARVHDCG